MPAEEVFARGRALRERVPLDSRDRKVRADTRPGVVEHIAAGNVGRLAHLVPLRIGRMAASPFTFYRGA
ncbi:hypothetical protein B0T44_25740, partial [Nocardia donostiensis]